MNLRMQDLRAHIGFVRPAGTCCGGPGGIQAYSIKHAVYRATCCLHNLQWHMVRFVLQIYTSTYQLLSSDDNYVSPLF